MDFEDILLDLAQRAIEVMTYRDLRDTLDAIEAAEIGLSSTHGLLAAAIATAITREIERRGLE